MFETILVVDDNEYKMESIVEAARILFPDSTIYTANCIKNAYRIIHDHYEWKHDPEEVLILSDMQMPFYSGECPDITGGHKLLAMLCVHEYEYPAVLISSEPVNDDYARSNYTQYIGSILYKAYESTAMKLEELLKAYAASQEGDKDGDDS